MGRKCVVAVSSLSKTQGLVDQATGMLNLILSVVVGTSNETLFLL